MRILGGRRLVYVRIVVAIFDFMTEEDWGEQNYFSSCHFFSPVWTCPFPHYLPLGLRGCADQRFDTKSQMPDWASLILGHIPHCTEQNLGEGGGGGGGVVLVWTGT